MNPFNRLLLSVLTFLLPFCVSCQTEEPEGCTLEFLADDPLVQCGTIQVPENRDIPNSTSIPVKYVVLKALKENPKPDPIVFLQGGPGAGSIFMYSFFRQHPLNYDRDIILVDQRGTGYSHSFCDDLGLKLFDILAENYSVMQEVEASEKLAEECRAEVDQRKISIESYNSLENARDIEEIRKKLGYKEWNLMGGSYGSRLALTLMREFPDNIRSAILMGPFPPNADMYGTVIPNFKSSLEAVINQCISAGQCSEDLLSNFYKKLEDLSTKPLTINYNGSSFTINPQDASFIVHQYLYQRNTIERTPALVQAIVDENEYGIYPALQTVESRMQYINLGMYMSVQANEEIPFGGLETYGQSIADHPEFKDGIGLFNSDVHVFPNWIKSQPKDIEGQPVSSNIPALVLAGEFDPITPPSYGELAVKTLDNGYLKILKNEGHVQFGPCFNELANAFLSDPQSDPGSNCPSTSDPLSFE